MTARIRGSGRAARIRRRAPEAAGAAVRMALLTLVAVRGLAALLLISAGAWMAYPPAGPITAGALILADRIADEWRRSAT